MSTTTCPFELAEMKTFLRVDSTDEDTLIASLMLAATEFCENFQQRTFITRTRYLYLDSFQLIIQPPYSPLVTITSIKYYDTAGALQTLDSAYYTVDTKSEPGRVVEAYNYYWPSTYDILNAVIVEYTSGYGAASANVPDDIKAQIMIIVRYLYERGGDLELLKNSKEMLFMRKVYNL